MKENLSNLEKKILDQCCSYPKKSSKQIAMEERTTEGNVNKTKSKLRKMGVIPDKRDLRPMHMADNSRPALSVESIPHFQSQGLTPEQRQILFKRRCQGDSVQEILADNPTISGQAAAAEVEAVERHGDRDIPHLEKTLLDEIGGEKEQDFLGKYPGLIARYESISAEFKANGRLSMPSFYDLFQLFGEIGIKCGKIAWMLPTERPPTFWTKVECTSCREPLPGVAVDQSTRLGREVLEMLKNKVHSSCSRLQY